MKDKKIVEWIKKLEAMREKNKNIDISFLDTLFELRKGYKGEYNDTNN